MIDVIIINQKNCDSDITRDNLSLWPNCKAATILIFRSRNF